MILCRTATGRPFWRSVLVKVFQTVLDFCYSAGQIRTYATTCANLLHCHCRGVGASNALKSSFRPAGRAIPALLRRRTRDGLQGRFEVSRRSSSAHQCGSRPRERQGTRCRMSSTDSSPHDPTRLPSEMPHRAGRTDRGAQGVQALGACSPKPHLGRGVPVCQIALALGGDCELLSTPLGLQLSSGTPRAKGRRSLHTATTHTLVGVCPFRALAPAAEAASPGGGALRARSSQRAAHPLCGGGAEGPRPLPPSPRPPPAQRAHHGHLPLRGACREKSAHEAFHSRDDTVRRCLQH